MKKKLEKIRKRMNKKGYQKIWKRVRKIKILQRKPKQK